MPKSETELHLRYAILANAWEFVRIKTHEEECCVTSSLRLGEKNLKWFLSEKVTRHSVTMGQQTTWEFLIQYECRCGEERSRPSTRRGPLGLRREKIARQDHEQRNTPLHRAVEYRSEIGYGFIDVFFLNNCGCCRLCPNTERRQHRGRHAQDRGQGRSAWRLGQRHQERRQERPPKGQRSEARFQRVDEEAVPAEASFAFCWRPSRVLRFPESGLQARSIMPVLAHVCGVRQRRTFQRLHTLNIDSILNHSDFINCSTRGFADAPLGPQHVNALWVLRVSR